MKAKMNPRIDLDNRTRIEEVVPLSTPLILFIDPSNACNFKCNFCPTGDSELIKKINRPNCVMNFDLYKKIINDLKEFNKPLKVLRLYKEGEPLLNKNFAKMVIYAKENKISERIDTTTNGLLLRPDIIQPIIDAGLDRINISVNGMSKEYFSKFCNVNIDFDKYIKNIINLYENKGNCEICIKIIGDYLTKNDKERFIEIFGNYADRIFIENLAPCWPDFDVEDKIGITIKKGIYNQEITDNLNICAYIFYMITVNSDGSVSLCFLDWKRNLIIGDIKKQSLKEIWNGDILFEHQIEHLKGNRNNNTTCNKCGQLSHCLPDNIDPYANDLLDKLTKSSYRKLK